VTTRTSQENEIKRNLSSDGVSQHPREANDSGHLKLSYLAIQTGPNRKSSDCNGVWNCWADVGHLDGPSCNHIPLSDLVNLKKCLYGRGLSAKPIASEKESMGFRP
jgi:hypothetical protein